MSQVTRCPACQTMFKVVADQLKIAQGWVRCGQCGEVFDAALQMAPAETVVPAPEQTLAHQSIESTQPAPAGPEPQPEAELPELEQAAADASLADESPAGPSLMAAAPVVDAAPDAELPLTAPQAPAPQPAEPDIASEVSFVRDARRREFWKKPLIRAALGLVVVLLLAALALQWLVRQKDALAVLHPRLVPLLETLCRPLDCQIRPLRRIGSLVIDSSSFVKTGPDTYRLGFVLKNNGHLTLEIPAMELTLTDGRDQALIRRVVTPGQFGAGAATLDADRELSGAVSLRVSAESLRGASPSPAGPLPVAGYRLLAFYP